MKAFGNDTCFGNYALYNADFETDSPSISMYMAKEVLVRFVKRGFVDFHALDRICRGSLLLEAFVIVQPILISRQSLFSSVYYRSLRYLYQ
jgi:hypothetical protein